MARPTPARLLDLHRLRAWPWSTWLFVGRRLRPDLELLLAKPGGVDVGQWWTVAHADEVAAAPLSVSMAKLLRAILSTAVEDGLIAVNPCTIKGAGVEHAAHRPVITPAQAWALADAVEARFRALVLLAAFGGLRRVSCWG